MSKTTKRVLSMVLAVLMLLSMLPAMTFAAEATDFATTYEGTAYDGVTISNSALLVDSSITDADGTVITRAWDGKDYLFTVGTNAFATIDLAFAKAQELKIACPDILLYLLSTGAGSGTNLVITMPCRVFGRKWTVAPMNEMTEDFSAIKSGTTDWTLNTNFVSTVDSTPADTKASQTSSANNCVITNTVSGKVEIYGVRFFDSFYFSNTSFGTAMSAARTTTSGQIDIKLQNVLLQNPPGKEWTGNHFRYIYSSNYQNTDSLTFKNVYFREIRKSRLFQQENMPAHVTFDSCYFNKDEVTTALTNNGASNFWLKQNTLNGSIVFKDSYLPISNDAKIINLAAGLTGTTPETNQSLTVTFDNNVFNNYNDATTTALLDIQLDAYTGIAFTNNYVYNTENTSKAIFANRGSVASRCADGDFVVTGNMLLGFKQADAVSTNTASMTKIFVEKNFTVNSVQTSVDAYKTATGVAISPKKGLATGASGSYYLDYDMTMLNTGIEIQTTTLDDGKVSIFADTTVKQATVLTDGTSKIKLKVSDILHGEIGSVNPTKTMYSDEDCTKVITEYDLAKLGKEIDTVYVKFEYAGTSNANIYKVSIVNTNLTSFNDMLAQGVATFRGKTFAADATTVYLPKGITKDGIGYAVFAGVPLKFVVDNAVVFEYSDATIPDAACKTDLILPAGHYGTINLHSSDLNFYGANFGIDPIDDSNASVENNFDWAFSEAWDTEHDTEIDIVNVRAAAAGTNIFDGITIKRGVADGSRAVNSAAINIKFQNLVIDIDNYYNQNGAFVLTNARIANNTTMVDNPDTFTLQNVYVAKNTANQLFHQPGYPTMTIDRLYLDTAIAQQPRAQIAMFWVKGTFNEVQPVFTIKNSNLRATYKDGYPWVRFDDPNGVNINIEDNIFYSNRTAQNLLRCFDSSSVINVINNTVLFEASSNLIETSSSAFPTVVYAEGSTMDGNRFVGIPEAKMNTGNFVLTNTYYSPSFAGLRNPEDLTGMYVEGMGDEGYYYDFNQTVFSGDIDGATEYPYFFDLEEVLPGLSPYDVYLVDTSITNAFNDLGSEFVVREWDGVEYSFYGGEIPFNNLSDAYAQAASDGVERPQIILLGWTDNTNLTIEAASDIYAINWNTAPMNEMTADFNAIKSEGADWTANEKYFENEIVVKGLRANASVTGKATINGITFTGDIDLAGSRTPSSGTVEFVINNSRMNATNIGEARNHYSALGVNANTSVTNTDKITFKNFWLDKCTTSTDTYSTRFFGDNDNTWPNIEFNATYADFSTVGFKFYHTGNKKYQTNDHWKGVTSSTSFVVKNSNFRRSDLTVTDYWNIDRAVETTVADYTRTVTFDNNVLYNWKNSSNVIDNQGRKEFKDANVINVTNNFVYNSESIKLLGATTATVSGDPAITVTGNKLLGVTNQSYSKDAIAENFYSAENLSITEHKDAKGTQYGSTGTYYLDYAMTTLNTSGSNSFNDVIALGTVIGSVAVNTDTTAVVVPSVDGDGMYYGYLGGKLYSFKVDNLNVFAMNGNTIPAAAQEFANVAFPSGAYGNITITTSQNIIGANAGINPNDKSGASAANEYEWEFNSNWDADNSTIFSDITVSADLVGENLVIDGVSFARYLDQERTIDGTVLNAVIKNSIVDGTPSGNATFFTDNPRAKNDTVDFVNNDSLLVKDVRIVTSAANQIFHETNVPNLTVDAFYCDATAAGKKRSTIAFFMIGRKNKANIVIKNSNFRNGTDTTVMAQIKGDGEYASLGDNMAYTFDNNIVVNAGSGYFMDVMVESVSAINFTNNTIISEATRLVDYNAGSGDNSLIADATVITNTLIEGNRFVGMTAGYIGLVDDNLSVAPTMKNNFYSSSKACLEDPTALIGEYPTLTGDNAYYLDYNMTVTNDTDAEDFAAALEKGITVGDVTFTEENTAVYLPVGTGKFHKFAGKLYEFVADEVNVFTNVGSTLPEEVQAFENVILPSGSYTGIYVSAAQKFYGSNMGINPNDKSIATAENNYDWALNKDWDTAYGTVIGNITLTVDAAGDISFDGITHAGRLSDAARTMDSENVNVTLTNVLVQGGNGGYLNLANNRGKNGRGVEANTTFGETNTDSFTLKDIRVGEWTSMRLDGGVEWVPANLTWDGLYYDSSIDPQTRSDNGDQYTDLAYIKSGSANKNRSYTVKNSNLRGTGTNAGSRPIAFLEGGYTALADGYTNEFTFADNVVYNFATGGQSYFANVYTADFSAIDISDNTFIQTSHTGNNLFVPVAAGKTDAKTTITLDGNKFVGLTNPLDIEIVEGAGVPAVTNTFVSSNKDAYKYGTAILGEKVEAMGENAYFLDFDMTKKSTDGYADYTVPANSVVYLPRSGQEYFDVDGTIYKFTANGSTIVENARTPEDNVPDAQNVILLAGNYGTITLTKPVNILGSNAGINPNVTHEMTTEDAANGFDWAFNPDWNRAYASKLDIINIDASMTAGDVTVDGIQIKKYYDDRRVSGDVVNVAFKNFIVVDGGNSGCVFTSWNAHNSLGLGADKFELINGRIVSVTSNQLLDEVNSANVTIDGLYMDATAAGKKRTIISFFKFAKQQQSKVVIKNSNFRNGVGANTLFTVTGAIDYNGKFDASTKTKFGVSYQYVAGDYVSVEIANNILYNAQGDNSGYLFNLGVEALYDVNITGNTIIDTKGNKMLTLYHAIADSEVKGSALDGEITFANNSVVGMDAHKLNFERGFNSNPVMTNCYYNASIEGLKNIFANTGKYHEAMNGGDYYADVARTQFASSYVEGTVATVNGAPVADLTDALENAVEGDVITLTTDVEIDEVFVVSGVTLDLNGHKLTTEYALGYDDSNIIDSNMTETSGIYVAKKALQVAQNNSKLPIYDTANGCYIFANVDLSYTYYENSSYYFGPEMAAFSTVEGQRVNALLRQNSADSGVEITIHLDWETGDYYSTQDYVYKPHYVEQYFSAANVDQHYYNVYFFAVFSGDALKQADTVSVKTIVKARGCVAESIATEFSM